MTTKQLMYQRFKIIASYPDSQFKVGDILDRNWCKYENDDEEAGIIVWQISDFPHLFRPLQWWEDRKPEEMPNYVRVIEDIPYYGFLRGQIVPVDIIKNKLASNMNKYHRMLLGKPLIQMEFVEPATKEEYESYLQSTNQLNLFK